jgi:hypothetical protein
MSPAIAGDPYVRVYYSIIEDERFDSVFDDDRRLATWLRLLMAADAAYPTPPPIPAAVNRAAFAHLVERGIVEELRGGRYRIHGLSAERDRRSAQGRPGGLARQRAPRERLASADPSLNGRERTVSQQEQEQEQEQEQIHPQPPPSGGADGLNPRAAGTNPRAKAERRRLAKLERAERRQLARSDGQISEAEYAELTARDAEPPVGRPRGYAYGSRPEPIGDVLGRMAASPKEDA